MMTGQCLQATEAPFINVIYDKDPLQQWVWGHTVLVGEAAHCTTPHASRSTNMSVQVIPALAALRARPVSCNISGLPAPEMRAAQ